MISVHPADPDTDRVTAVELLRSCLNPAYDAARFDWLYNRNPAGRGRLWLAVDTLTGTAIGTAGAFPRHFRVDGRHVRSWVLGDFCIREQYRTLGPALRLQRACLEVVTDQGAVLWYDFPSKAMVTVYRRLRIAPRERVHRLVRLLRVDQKVAELTRIPWVARGVGSIVNPALGRRYGSAVPGLAVDVHSGPCGEEFTRLAEAEAAAYGVCLHRSAEYLNWRFRDDPTVGHDIVTARCEGRLVAYAVLTVRAGTATVTDLFGVRDRRILASLTETTVSRAAERKCETVTVSLLESDDWIGMFRELGFVLRGSSEVVVAPSESSSGDRVLDPPTRVFLMQGDRDS
jgi:GNAT superfamily N-acetyltransferase